MPEAYDVPPITAPEMAPLFPGVKPCGSTEQNESCSACNELVIMADSIGSIRVTIVRERLIQARNAILGMCALIKGCSTETSRNIAPYEDGTACLCKTLMTLIDSFKRTLNSALATPRWSDKATRELRERLNSQEDAASNAIIDCYRTFRISNNKTSQDEIIKRIKTYS
jgi:hypothetical protein